METFGVDIAGRHEELPVLEIGEGVKIAFFNLHGNTELTEHCGRKLAELIGDKADVLLTAESKGLQLTHCVARELGHKFYAVARKSKKLYMQDGIEALVQSITTKEQQHMYLSAHDAELLRGKRVAIVDDVISTGGSIAALGELVKKAGGTAVMRASVLAEGSAKDRDDIVYLADIPLL